MNVMQKRKNRKIKFARNPHIPQVFQAQIILNYMGIRTKRDIGAWDKHFYEEKDCFWTLRMWNDLNKIDQP